MYVGRIVAVGATRTNKLVAMYRVSARSFPNRQAVRVGDAVAIVPKDGFESDVKRNPYITYNCLRQTQRYCVVANGTQTDPIVERLSDGVSARDAMTAVLFGLDYEHDHLRTPRIAAIIDLESRNGTLGIVRTDAILVRTLKPRPGEALYLATYGHHSPDEKYRDDDFDASSPDAACEYVIGKGVFGGLDQPVSAACGIEKAIGFDVSCRNV